MFDNNNDEPQQQLDSIIKNLINSFKLSSLHQQFFSSKNQLAQGKIRYFNDTAVYKIKQQQYKQALIFLKQAQKMMEESIKNRNKINSIYILCVMQNQVCVYVNLWMLQKAQKYIQTLIQNIQNQIQISQSKNKTKKLYFVATKQNRQQLKQTISKYKIVINYYLQYSSILSQLQKHQAAVEFIKKTIKLIKNTCQKMMQLQIANNKLQNGNGKSYGSCVLEYLVSVKEIVDLSIITEKVKQIAKLLKNINNINENDHKNEKNLKWLQQFDHTKVTQIFGVTVQDMEHLINNIQEPNTITKWQMVIYLSISFFNLATQCRLMTALKYQENRKFTQPFKLSKLFHLQAIQIYSKNIPYESKYLQNIVQSFQSHYETNLIGVRQESHNKSQNVRAQSKSFLFDNQILQASIANQQSHDYLIQSFVKNQNQQNGNLYQRKEIQEKIKNKQMDQKLNKQQNKNQSKNYLPNLNQPKQQKDKSNKIQKYYLQNVKSPKSNHSKSKKKIKSRKSVQLQNSNNRFSIYGLNPHQDIKNNWKNKKKETKQILLKSSKQKMKKSSEGSNHKTKLSRQLQKQKQKSSRSKNQHSNKMFLKELSPPTCKKIQQQYMLSTDNNKAIHDFKNKQELKNKRKNIHKQKSKEKQKKQHHKQVASQSKRFAIKRQKSTKSQKKILIKNK